MILILLASLELEFPRKSWNSKSIINANSIGVMLHDQKDKVACNKRRKYEVFQITQVLEHPKSTSYRVSRAKKLPSITKSQKN